MLNTLQWLVVPGGPGLSNSYLKYAFEKMSIMVKTDFYDMYGSPESDNKNPSIAQMLDQVAQIINKNPTRECGLIAHSFGSYIALKAVQQRNLNIKAIILLNPIPFELNKWKEALASISLKVPTQVINEIISLCKKKGEGADTVSSALFAKLFPYYIGKKSCSLPLEVDLDFKACNAIAQKVPDYDFKDFLASSKVPIVRIVGEYDPFFIHGNDELMEDKTIIIPEVGHYPFFEDPQGFCNAIGKVQVII